MQVKQNFKTHSDLSNKASCYSWFVHMYHLLAGAYPEKSPNNDRYIEKIIGFESFQLVGIVELAIAAGARAIWRLHETKICPRAAYSLEWPVYNASLLRNVSNFFAASLYFISRLANYTQDILTKNQLNVV